MIKFNFDLNIEKKISILFLIIYLKILNCKFKKIIFNLKIN